MRFPTLASILTLALPAVAAAEVTWDVRADTWAATDHLGRTVVGADDAPTPREDKLVGAFYFLWHGAHTTTGPFNISEITEGDPPNPAWGPENAFHHWGEPLWDFYIATDPYVHRRNIMMLSDAGVDFLMMDASNAFAYEQQLGVFLDEATALKAEGHRVPQITFLAHQTAVTTHFEGLYRSGEETWNGEKHIADYKVDEGVLSFVSTGNDPILQSGADWNFPASTYSSFSVRMKNGTGSQTAQLYWGRAGSPGFSEAKSIDIPIVAQDGDYRVYNVNLAGHPEWTGTITKLRFDPASNAGATGPIEIDRISLLGGPGVLRIWEFEGDHHPDLWFRWKGRPVMMPIGYRADEMPPETDTFFTRRDSWAWSNPGGWFGDGENKWAWIDDYPQAYGWEDGDSSTPVYMPVAVASHPTRNIGRSYHDGMQPPPEQRNPAHMEHWREQVDRALAVDPEIVMITGWNEWVAQRFIADSARTFIGEPLPEGGSYFVDAYNEEYNRDIEPMRGGYWDSSYYLMVDSIRRFKGVREAPEAPSLFPIAIDGNFEDWDAVEPEYRDWRGDSSERDHAGWGSTGQLINTTWRNDIVRTKAAATPTHIAFFVETAEAITTHLEPSWMHLYIDSDNDPSTGWNGFDRALNRTNVRIGMTTVEEWNGSSWSVVGDVTYRRAGTRLEVSVPRSMLGELPEPLAFQFKWADNCLQEGDAIEFTTNGDAAPNGRFTYPFRLSETAAVTGWRVLGP